MYKVITFMNITDGERNTDTSIALDLNQCKLTHYTFVLFY